MQLHKIWDILNILHILQMVLSKQYKITEDKDYTLDDPCKK